MYRLNSYCAVAQRLFFSVKIRSKSAGVYLFFTVLYYLTLMLIKTAQRKRIIIILKTPSETMFLFLRTVQRNEGRFVIIACKGTHFWGDLPIFLYDCLAGCRCAPVCAVDADGVCGAVYADGIGGAQGVAYDARIGAIFWASGGDVDE